MVDQEEVEKIHRDLARKRTVVRLLKDNVGATIHNYKTPSGRECYRMLTAIDAPVPRDPLINISCRTVGKLLDSGRLKHSGTEDDYIILNPSFKNKKHVKKESGICETECSVSTAEETRKTRPETGSLFPE